MKQKKSNRPRTAQRSKYKITNWSSYNQALRQRGSLELWIDSELENNWDYLGVRQQGAPFKYSDMCIEMACMVREIYRLPYRQTQGFLQSIIKLLKWSVKVPDYTTINRRRKKLTIEINTSKNTEKKYIVMDSTGVKVYGEGEWKVRQHGWSKHRTWRKIHLSLDEKTNVIESCATTSNAVDDAAMVAPLLAEVIGEINQFAGDGGYDKTKVYKELARRKIKPIIPPQKNAKISKHGNCKGKENKRDKNIRAIRKSGRKRWKEDVNYHRRSLAETAMFRIKKIFGDKLSSRLFIQQQIEVKLKCLALNKMTDLGLPDTIKLKKVA